LEKGVAAKILSGLGFKRQIKIPILNY